MLDFFKFGPVYPLQSQIAFTDHWLFVRCMYLSIQLSELSRCHSVGVRLKYKKRWWSFRHVAPDRYILCCSWSLHFGHKQHSSFRDKGANRSKDNKTCRVINYVSCTRAISRNPRYFLGICITLRFALVIPTMFA